MKTEHEIRNKIKIWEEIKDTSPVEAFDFVQECEIVINVLKWTLGEEDKFWEEE